MTTINEFVARQTRRRPALSRPALIQIALLLGLAACHGTTEVAPPVSTPTTVVRIDLSNTSLRLNAGDVKAVTALPRGSDGRPLGDATVHWRSADATIASVSDLGVVTAQRIGTTIVSADAGNVTASLTVTVVPPVSAARVVVTPSTLTLGVGDAEFADAVVYDVRAQPVVTARPVWTSGDTNIAVVDVTGRIAARRAGVVPIVATHDGAADTLVLNIAAGTAAPSLAGRWTLAQVAGRNAPTVYREFRNEPVGDRIVALVEIRIDSATATVTASGAYTRRYYFSEWHDGVQRYRFAWGDRGRYAIRSQGAAGGSVRFVSDYIQNLWTPGTVTDGALHFTEELWTGETPESTRWVKVGS